MLEETQKGIDFTQYKSQLEFADACFGSGPTLQQVTVKVISIIYFQGYQKKHVIILNGCIYWCIALIALILSCH